VTWVSRMQKIVALSTTEAEYVTMTETCKELIWKKDFLKDLCKEQVTLSLHSDSQSAIDLTNNLVYLDRTNHIDVWYHFIRILLKDSVLLLVEIHTTRNPTDMLTKVGHDGEAEDMLSFCGSSRVKIWSSVATNTTMSRESKKYERDGVLLLC